MTMDKTILLVVGIFFAIQFQEVVSNLPCKTQFMSLTMSDYNSIFDTTQSNVYDNVHGVYCVYRCLKHSPMVRMALFPKQPSRCSCQVAVVDHNMIGTIEVYAVQLDRINLSGSKFIYILKTVSINDLYMPF